MNKEDKKKLKKIYLEEINNNTSNERNCYCKEGQDFCGDCEICGAPGHIRHYPDPVPYTGAWCDKHYKLISIFLPFGYMTPLLFIVLGLIIYFIIKQFI